MIFTSSYPTLDIPQDATLWSILETQHAVGPNAHTPAYICSVTNREITFAELVARVKHVAAGLYAHGIRHGDVVVVHSFNCIEYPIVFLALNRIGAICSPSSPLFNADELYDQLVVAKATAIVTHKALADVAIGGAKRFGLDTTANMFTMASSPADVDLVAIESFIREELPLPDLPPLDPSTTVFLPFSSGTTARPKGVELTARALLASAMCYGYLEAPGAYTIGLLPFFHIMATMIFHACLYAGKPLVVLPRFQPDKFLEVVARYKMDKILIAPPVVLFLAQHPMVDNYDLSHLKTLGCGGAPLGVEIEALVEKRLGVTVFQGFGMTELGGAGTYATATSKRAGSTGKLLPNTSLQVRSLNDGTLLGPDSIGELLFQSPSVMRGYLDNDDATRAAFSADGFLSSGDIGYVDADGFVFIVDRIKELIKYKGHQVAPAELEDVLNLHPDVKDSCVVRGFDFNTHEEIPKAFVVLHDDGRVEHADVTMKSILEFVASKVAKYKIVRAMEFTDKIPKSLSGKILRRELQVRENETIAAFHAQRAP